MMKKKRFLRRWAAAMAVVVASMSLGMPRAQAMMAPTQTAVSAAASDRAADMKLVQTTLENKMVSERLKQMGLSPDEIQARLNGLSDQKLHQVAMQIDHQKAAGDGGATAITILIVVAVVALFIWLWDEL